jgi:hypothetical protein
VVLQLSLEFLQMQLAVLVVLVVHLPVVTVVLVV